MPNVPMSLGGVVSAPIQGQVLVAETGTAVTFSAVEVILPGKFVIVWAPDTNSADVYIGGSDVENQGDGTGNGVVVPAGEVRTIFPKDLQDAYLNGTAGDWVSYAAS